MKVGDRVSVVAQRLSSGKRVVVRALVCKNTVALALADEYVCVRVPLKIRLDDLMNTPMALRLEQRGVSWAQGWYSREADALRVSVAL
jgi:hypothetical protein